MNRYVVNVREVSVRPVSVPFPPLDACVTRFFISTT
jgi:hypothetical protein